LKDQALDPVETLGDRVRRIRMKRGLSLAKVAGGDFSRAFLSQVELNKSRPSVRVLRVIADRLEAPVDYLLDGSTPSLDREIALEKARIELAKGGFKRCLALLEPALDSTEWPLGVDARLCAGEAMLKLGRGEEGRLLLEAQRQAITGWWPAGRSSSKRATTPSWRRHCSARARRRLPSSTFGRPGSSAAADPCPGPVTPRPGR
jgi:transcriptional regulator with XRE-family HTH domain